MPKALPPFVEPMLAVLGREPFDSDEYLFEVKWDGLRALSFVEAGGYRILGRRRSDFTARYPELEFLADLPPGTVLDGELVVLRGGKPDFHEVMAREQARGEARIRSLTQTHPALYVVFDLLYAGFEPVLKAPLAERRERLASLVESAGDERLVLSEGVVGQGVHLYEEVARRGLEGIVAKRLRSPYRPGRRSDSWTKLKPRRTLQCVILGYDAEGDDLRSLVIAAEFNGVLEPVGRVGSGLNATVGRRLLQRLRERPREGPLIEVADQASWVEPELFCTVSYVERNANGGLRAPVFEGVVGGA